MDTICWFALGYAFGVCIYYGGAALIDKIRERFQW